MRHHHVALAFLLSITLATPALAGDRAGIGFLGYSEDARYFAFEEFGIQDGSGFPYANLFVLDLAADAWVTGTPVRVRIEDQDTSLATVRADAREAAQATLDRLDIGDPVDIIALHGDGVLDIDDQALRFGRPGYGMNPPDQVYELALSPVEAELEQSDCGWSLREITGFALTLTVDGKAREVYRDSVIPESRNCPQGYRLYAVVTPFGEMAASALDLTPGMVAIVSVYPRGFEGPDRRFIAVPIGR